MKLNIIVHGGGGVRRKTTGRDGVEVQLASGKNKNGAHEISACDFV